MNWIELPVTEKENYLYFHENAFKEDLEHAEEVILRFPRGSIISSYYSMHDITKLFLAKNFNVKIANPEIHKKTIEALEYFIKDEKLRERLLDLLKKAENVYYNTERLKEKILPVLLKRGKQERGKAQYYTEDYTKKTQVNSQKAIYFLDTIVKPYIKLLKGLME